jgi:hypothetical protein
MTSMVASFIADLMASMVTRSISQLSHHGGQVIILIIGKHDAQIHLRVTVMASMLAGSI